MSTERRERLPLRVSDGLYRSIERLNATIKRQASELAVARDDRQNAIDAERHVLGIAAQQLADRDAEIVRLRDERDEAIKLLRECHSDHSFAGTEDVEGFLRALLSPSPQGEGR